jgi:hypothetical protein
LINESWDRAFIERFIAIRRDELIAYTDEEIFCDAGQGGFEIRTFIAIAGATEGATGQLLIYAPLPVFAVGRTAATMTVQ